MITTPAPVLTTSSSRLLNGAESGTEFYIDPELFPAVFAADLPAGKCDLKNNTQYTTVSASGTVSFG